MTNVLYLNHTAEIGGAEISLLLLLNNLNRERFCPIIVLPRSGPLQARLTSNGIETVITRLNKINVLNPLPYLCTVVRLTKLMRQLNIGLVHCNMDICNQYALIAAKLNNIPIICHTRNMLGKRSFQRMFLGWADVLIANSRGVANSYARYISRNQRVEVIYNGVDVEQFHPDGRSNLRGRLGVGEDEFVVGQIGRINPNKGQDVFIKALTKVLTKHSNVRALIVGDTVIDNSKWFLEELKQLVRDLGLADRVIFTGFVEDIIDMYRCLDLVVLPTRSEGFGRTIAEAMAMAKPVIASRTGGLPELILEGETGFLVPTGDSNALADAILKLVDNRQLASEFCINGRRRVEKEFTIEKNVRGIEQVYVSLLLISQDTHKNLDADVGGG